MKSVFCTIATTLLLSGCFPSVDGKSIYLSKNEYSKIASECRNLNKIGDYQRVKIKINADVDHVKRLIANDDLQKVKSEIEFLQSRIQKNSDLLIKLLGQENSAVSYTQSLKWVLGAEDLGFKNQGFGAWQIHSAEIVNIYSWNGENKNLIKTVKIDIHPDEVIIRFQRPATLIELCQLQQTIVMHLRVNFQNSSLKIRSNNYKLLAKNVERL